MKQFIIFLFTSFIMLSCTTKEKQLERKAMQWLASSEWKKDFPFAIDTTVNVVAFYQQNMLNKPDWDIAYQFLKSNDWMKLEQGRHELSESGVYATVTDYMTKDPDSAKYEAHRQYIDIQYVASGKELIDILPLSAITEDAEYREDRDIVFFEGKKGKQLFADKNTIFIFFPEDVHKPCLKVDESELVRKIVVKIPVATN